jgi:uncharacterized peroxidase-related enzyme
MSAPAFTLDVLDWKPWLASVDVATATPDQVAILDESGPHARTSAYYHVLLHDAPVLRERSQLFNAVMYGEGGLPRADRELGATAESIANGCTFSTSVHARFHIQVSKKPETVARLFADGLGALLEARERAVVSYTVKLAKAPPAASGPDVAALREAGLSHAEILDLTHTVAMFAWTNRLMLTLGEAVGAADEAPAG